jgi:hypothetical protein
VADPTPSPGTALAEWRKGRTCPSCGAAIAGGPYEVCVNRHRYELEASVLHRAVNIRGRRLFERGYWLRWLLGLLGCVLLTLTAWIAVLLLLAGPVYAPMFAWVVLATSIVCFLALVFSPPVARAPTTEVIERGARASGPL